MRNHTYTEDLLILNLQLFAEGPANTTESANLSVEMKEFYDGVLLKYAKPKLVHEQFAQKKPIPAGRGKTIEFRGYDRLDKVDALTPLVEGVTPKGQSLKAYNVTATIKQYGGYVELTDLLDLTAIDDNIAQAVIALGDQAGLVRDTIVRDIMSSTNNKCYAGHKVMTESELTGEHKLTVKDLRHLHTKMKRNNIAPCEGGAYVMICHPDVVEDLKNDPEYADAVKYTDPKPIFDGEVCKIENIRIVESSEALIEAKEGDESLSVYHNFVLGANAYGVTDVAGRGVETIIKQLGAGDDPLNQRSTVGWKTNMTAAILSHEALCDYMCCATNNSPAN